MTPQPLFAAFHGGWEIFWSLAPFVLLPLLVIAIIGAIICLLLRRHHPAPDPPIIPSVASPAETTKAPQSNCPHCGKPVPPTALGGICPECMLKAGFATQTEGPGANGPHGTKVVQPPHLPAEIASLFPQLEILECLGRGGMGVVYKARQPRLNRLVALKILAREKEQDTQFAERFTREAQALARLNHPNIVTVYDFGAVAQASSLSPSEKEPAKSETGATPVLHYLLMEFVDGLNLRQLLQAGKMPSAQALTIVPKICEALQYAHEQGIVHRDIKPENILLDKSGRVKIADFGIAKMMGDEAGQQTLTGAKEAVGTPHYMAPEQIEKPLTVDHRADIYSLGVVFYEMLTGELPLGKFQPPSAKVQIDVRLDEVVLHALEKEPDRRYQQASQVKNAVETIVTTTSRIGSDESPQTESEKNRSQLASAAISPFRRGVRAGFLTFLLVVAAAVIITLLLPRVYVATAVVRLTGPEPPNPYHLQTEFEVIQSMAVLDPVAASLNLGQRWGKKSGGETFSDDQTVSLMKGMIEIRPVRNTALIEIRFFSDSPKEAAEIANKIAETYCARPPGHTGEIIDRAIPPWRPFRPNVLLNIFLGIVAGGLVGTLAGLTVGLFSNWRWRATRHAGKQPADEANPQNANPARARSGGFGTTWRFAAFILVLILSYELSKTVFSHLIAGHFSPIEERRVAGPPFIAHLQRGTVELLAVSYSHSNSPAWWRADGSPTKSPAYTFNPGEGSDRENQKRRVVLRVQGVPVTGAWFTAECTDAQDVERGYDAHLGGTQLLDVPVVYLGLPNSARHANLKVGIATMPWQRSMPLQLISGDGLWSTEFSWAGLWWRASVESAYQVGPDVKVTGYYTDTNTNTWQSELVLVDTSGKEHSLNQTGNTEEDLCHFRGTYPHLQLNEIKEFRFRIRPFDMVEFRNIALNPGYKTCVEVVDAAKQELMSNAAENFDPLIEQPLPIPGAQLPSSTFKSADLREARARLAELAVVYSPQSPVYLKQQARIQTLENEDKAHPDEPLDLREAQAELAELRVTYAESNPAIQRALARIKELERLTKEEPNDPADLREAEAHLAELRVDYTEQNPAIQEALAKIKALEQKDVTPVRIQE